jgi:peptidoglycan hydrolase-like protein with peptidoglycan-binding domain
MIQDKKKNSEDIKEMQQYLKDINLYDGDIDSIEGPKTKEAQKTFKALNEKGMSAVDMEIYGYRKSVGLPAELMLTGEYEMWEEYGDNFRQQMSDEEFEQLYGEERQTPIQRMQEMGSNLKERIGEIDLMDKLFKYVKEQ